MGIGIKKTTAFLPAQRRQRILGILREELIIRGTRLSALLDVSEMTIRRDLDVLEKQGLVERTHGGAILRQERVDGKFFYHRSRRQNPGQKQSIAQRAASLIEPNDVVYIGEGYTASQIIRHVDPHGSLTVFTNNLGVLPEIGEMAAEIILLPGVYDVDTQSLAGPLTLEMIQQIHAAKVFLGADGLSLSAGMTTPNLDIAVIERSMIQNTRGKVIVMAEHAKFGLVAQVAVAPLRRIDVIITNREIPGGFRKDLEKLEIELIVA